MFIFFIVVLAMLVPTMNTIEAQSQTTPTKQAPTLFFVVGSDWQACGNWKSWSVDFKLGYTAGHLEGVSQVMSFLSDDANSFTKMKGTFSASAGLSNGELTKAVDNFCSDYRNVKMPIPNAMMLVSADIAGLPPQDEKSMRHLRCTAAAGNDQSKIAECNNQP
jgi:hypothetical protein